MLIIFHYCVSLIFQILKNRKRPKLVQESFSKEILNELDLENDVKFDPPVYRQRYARVYEILINQKWRNKLIKLVDFGCAEFNLFVFIKNLNIEEILFVDIDENLLKEKTGKIEPLLADYLRRRQRPLEVSVLIGSVVEPDFRLKKADVVTAIELIEHLYPDSLDAFPYNVFSYICPKLVIITTPNADFNIIFRSKGFRHPDHKFEWTRNQFEDWAKNIVKRFPDYIVEFSGIGMGPENSEKLGCCSQQALFIRKDLVQDNYISSIYAISCTCDKHSLCKGPPAESKLLCNCLCPLCLPDFSIGVCTYYSRSKSDAVNTVKKEYNTKASYSEDYFCNVSQVSYNTSNDEEFTNPTNYINHSQNIYFKLIQKIDFPFETDQRSEQEKLLQTFQYRIHNFSTFNSRFYITERERCEIPVLDIMYGDIYISLEETTNLLINAGYTIEKCTIRETELCENCIISTPMEMEDITSSSEFTESYSSRNSEDNDTNNFESKLETYSDWDEVPYTPKTPQGTPSSILEPSSGPKNADPLFDSGYLKSPSPLEANALPEALPQLTNFEYLESAETDHFEDVFSTPNLSSEDNKLHLKKAVAKDKFVCSVLPESPKPKIDINRINELDRFQNISTTKTFMSNILKPQNEFKKSPLKDAPVAGPSSAWKKSRKVKDKRLFENKELLEVSPLDDAKSITNCIIQNSLNKIDIGDEIINRQTELIQELSPQHEEIPIINQDEPHVFPVARLDDVAPLEMVENGDLANNNRDNEGNNLAPRNFQEQEVDEGIDLLNDNIEEFLPPPEDNNIFDNNNDLIEHANNDEVVIPLNEHNIVEVEDNPNEIDFESEHDSVARASREALFDANSEQDLLEDFDIPPQADHEHREMLNLDRSVVLVSLQSVSSSGTRRNDTPVSRTTASQQHNTNSFPNWLLQILGAHVAHEETEAAPLGNHDEPHFYCQGDGLGVHPSVIAVEIDEAEDADNETSSEESSSNNTADFAEVEPGPSDMFDMSSLPEESSLATSFVEDNNGQSLGGLGSVVYADRELNDSASTNHHSVENFNLSSSSAHYAIGTNLVNGIIKSAIKEVSQRTEMNGANKSESSLMTYVTSEINAVGPSTDETVQDVNVGSIGNLVLENNDAQYSDGSEVSEYFEIKNEDS